MPFASVNSLVRLIDDLRDVGVHKYVELPRICVVGTQSAGKSSVIESIVGWDFLPRGEGVVTRRPLDLRLVRDANADGMYAIFDQETQQYTDFNEVKAEIERKTDLVAGKKKGIVNTALVLNIYGPDCPDLTLIDLPGITRVPLADSDQGTDIERVTKDMAAFYVEDKRTIILAVIPANVDVSTSDALQLAKQYDPRGIRTVGVVTKIDIMDRGSDATRLLNGLDIPLQLGYVGVKNRNTADLASRRTVADAVQEEQRWFAAHQIYGRMDQRKLGTQALVAKLTEVLHGHIHRNLPEIRQEIGRRLAEEYRISSGLGDGVPEDDSSRQAKMFQLVNKYSEALDAGVRGKYNEVTNSIRPKKNGCEIRNIFNGLLAAQVNKSIADQIDDSEIANAIESHEGDRLPGFPSADTFESLIKPRLAELSPEILACLDDVVNFMHTLSTSIIDQVFPQFQALGMQVRADVDDVIGEHRDATRTLLEQLVKSHTQYLFTNDESYLRTHAGFIGSPPASELPSPRNGPNGNQVPGSTTQPNPGLTQPHLSPGDGPPLRNMAPDPRPWSMNSGASTFVGGVKSMVGRVSRKPQLGYNESFLQQIRERLNSYFSLVLRNLRDSVPRIVGQFFVRELVAAFPLQLIERNNKRLVPLTSLLAESPEVAFQRENCAKAIRTLRDAQSILQSDPAYRCYETYQSDGEEEADNHQQQQPYYQHQRQHQGGSGSPGGLEYSPPQAENQGRRQPPPQRQKGDLIFGKTKLQNPLM